MAMKKTTPASTGRKVTIATAAPSATQQSTVVRVNNGDIDRLLREAAWSRMFGRAEAKNPFAR